MICPFAIEHLTEDRVKPMRAVGELGIVDPGGRIARLSHDTYLCICEARRPVDNLLRTCGVTAVGPGS